MLIPQLPFDVARCMGNQHKECTDCMRRLSPPHDHQWWMGPWVLEDEKCPSHLPAEPTAKD